MKIPIGDLDWFDIWIGIIFIVVIGQTTSCAVEISKYTPTCQEDKQ